MYMSSFGNSNSCDTILKILCNQRQGLNICHINAQSLHKKVDELRHLCETSNIHIVCIFETWFRKEICDDLYSMRGFKLLRSDRNSHAGGVAIYIRNNIKCKLICHNNVDDCIEYLFVELKLDVRKLLVGCIYRPRSNIDLTFFFDRMERLLCSYDEIIISGDFNCNLLCDKSLMDNMGSIGLFPINTTTPTHFSISNSTLLDLFFVSDKSKTLLYDQVAVPQFSKHDLIFMCYDFKVYIVEKFITYRNFKNIDFIELKKSIESINWSDIYHLMTINEQAEFLQSNIVSLYDQHVPLKKKIIKKNEQTMVQQGSKRRDIF